MLIGSVNRLKLWSRACARDDMHSKIDCSFSKNLSSFEKMASAIGSRHSGRAFKITRWTSGN